MGYRNLGECLRDLEAVGQLVRVEEEVDARLEAAEIQRRCFQRGGPAILFTRIKNCRFPMVSNLFGTMERGQFLFRDTLEQVRRLIELKIDPTALWRRPQRYWRTPWSAFAMLPRRVRRAPCLAAQTTVSQLPQLQSWPNDGGAFITLPQVYTEDPNHPGPMKSNLGMYRVQISGNHYRPDEQIGLHYQIHRGIGVHHEAARQRGEPLPVNIFVGGTPAMTLAAVMPLPEGLSELTFAGALSGRRIPLVQPPAEGRANRLPIYAEADFCISGTVTAGEVLPEGPFGDHLGYYSLQHEFPVLRVERVYHRRDAVWPFTVVGRPPQEDTTFGALIHELTGPIIPTVIPGVRAVHAVDAAGVHPLLLAIGSERYTPYTHLPRPQELLTQANAILGTGQMSLAKYLWIVNESDDQELDIHDIERFLRHALARLDPRRDLHFQTCTTIDTLDYSGTGFNSGSKVVLAAVGPPIRKLSAELPRELPLPDGFVEPRVCFPGVLAIRGPAWSAATGSADDAPARLCRALGNGNPSGGVPSGFPLIVLVDDSLFVSRSLQNFLWVTFTRSNPARDIDGVGAFHHDKHWGCAGPLVIDARIKPHHAPPLVEDPETIRRVDALATRGLPISRWV